MNVSQANLAVDPASEPGTQAKFSAAMRSARERFAPRNGWQEWVVEQVAWLMIRISQGQQDEQQLRDHASFRAREFWEDDQKVAAATLGAKLSRQPAKTVAKLRQTLAGTDWLLVRWRSLARLDPANWTEDQVALANQMVGAEPGDDPAAPGFAMARVLELEAIRPKVAMHDAIVRGLVENGLSDAHVPGLATLRAEQRTLDRRMKFYTGELATEPAPAIAHDETKPFAPASFLSDDKTKPSATTTTSRSAQTNPFAAKLPPEIDDPLPDWLAGMPRFSQAKPVHPSMLGSFIPVAASRPPARFPSSGRL